ncbi:MAG: triose-phosphate isomerase [Bacteroidota bacterium]
MRKKIVAGNWKMNKNYSEAMELVNEITNLLFDTKDNNKTILLSPPAIYLKDVVDLVSDYPSVYVAAQNCAATENGAYTGEVSASMLYSIGVTYVIIGHSERRLYFNETNSILNNKIEKALLADLQVVFCCGESLEQRENNSFFEVIKTQLLDTVFKLSAEQFKQITIAYEPIWAIGTGKTASAEQAQQMHQFIRECIKNNYTSEIANQTSILYGGSCNAKNASELFSQSDIDGGLIGGASLQAQDFYQIISSV